MTLNFKVIAPSGILDGTRAEYLRKIVDEALLEGAEIILVNLKEITFVDSSGLGVLVVLLKQVRSHNRQLCLCSINDQVKMLFELTSMDQVFKVYDNEDSFEEAVLSV
ncbi:MAG: STAS domain-containing protein [Cyanobacteria bacterium REEB459]|nr:STAS domain-containing protein [Cyanobacteria bacterium REEB459]